MSESEIPDDASMRNAAAAPPAAGKPGSGDRRRRIGKIAVFAAAIAVAAALGSVAGALAGAALFAPSPGGSENKGMAGQIRADIAGLKASLERDGKNTATQFARLSDRIERAEKAQAEPAARIARLSESVERLEKALGTSRAEVTGSVAGKSQVQSQVKSQARLPLVMGWWLRDVIDGRALVESRYGIFEVVPGSPLPGGGGRVETIRRQDGRWVVVTSRGVISALD